MHISSSTLQCFTFENAFDFAFGTFAQVIEVGKRRANDMKDFIAKMVVAISKNPDGEEEKTPAATGQKMSYFEL